MEKPNQQRRRTNFGWLALVVSATLNVTWVLLDWESRIVKFPMSKDIEQNLSNFIFDCGAIFELATVVLSIVGIIQGKRNRIAGIVALALMALGLFHGMLL